MLPDVRPRTAPRPQSPNARAGSPRGHRRARSTWRSLTSPSGGSTPSSTRCPTRTTPTRVRAWAPSAAFREAVRSAALATLAFYVGIVETLANEADQGDGGDAERERARSYAKPVPARRRGPSNSGSGAEDLLAQLASSDVPVERHSAAALASAGPRGLEPGPDRDWWCRSPPGGRRTPAAPHGSPGVLPPC